jgi:hypothetical protein
VQWLDQIPHQPSNLLRPFFLLAHRSGFDSPVTARLSARLERPRVGPGIVPRVRQQLVTFLFSAGCACFMIPWVYVYLISIFVATGSNNSCVLLQGDVLCTIRFLLLSPAKLIWILRFDFPFRQLGLLLFSLPLAVVPVSIFLPRSSFFFCSHYSSGRISH